jgi:hypothetical protein
MTPAFMSPLFDPASQTGLIVNRINVLMKIRLSPFAGSVFVHSARSIKISHVKKVIR